MADNGRSRRASNDGKSNTQAYAELVKQRRAGGRVGPMGEWKDEEDVYDVLEESQYAEVVAKRREEGADFVEDDDGMGYVDVGEEEQWGAGHGAAEDDEEHLSKPDAKRQKTGKQDRGNKKAPKVSKAAKQSIHKMFTAAAAKPVAIKNDAETNKASDDLLESILAGDDDRPSRASRPPASSAAPALAGTKPVVSSRFGAPARPASRPVAAPGRAARPLPRQRATAAQRLSRVVQNVTSFETSIHGGDTAAADFDAPQDMDSYQEQPFMDDADMPAGDPPDQSPGKQAGSAAEEPSGGLTADAAQSLPGSTSAAAEGAGRASANADMPTPMAGKAVQQLKREGDEGTPSASAARTPHTPWQTPAPAFAELATPQTAVATAGWQELCDEQPIKAEAEESYIEQQEEEGKPWMDDDSLPLENDKLPFFLLDAHEEPATPGTLYLFGKVPVQGQHQSCCAVVENCQRCMFFVPQPRVFTGAGLAALEAEAATDSSQKIALIRHLHELASEIQAVRKVLKQHGVGTCHDEAELAAELKAEVREVLKQHGVDHFVLKPVRRSYAFELAEIPRGEQWVLKVRYPASKSALPLGLSGEHFAAILGSQQSTLESVVLKRRLMGPSWLTLACPTRVDAGAQVSWCKLEVRLGSPKMVTAGCRDRQHPPPLIVAALNLKTTVGAQADTNEVMAASVVYLSNVDVDRPLSKAAWNNSQALRHFSILRKLDGAPFPAGFEAMVQAANRSEMGKRNGGSMLSVQSTERALLTNLLARLRMLDADVYVGHNISAFDLDVLLHRLQHHKVPQWSRIGRLKRSSFPNLGGGGHTFGGGAGAGMMSAIAGRLLCDTYLGARELLREVDYTMTTLARVHLGQARSDLAASDVPGKYESGRKLMELVQHTESDAWLALSLATHLNLLPLSRQLSAITGFLWSRTLQGQRAQRIEMLLLHEFYARKFLLPDKLTGRERERQNRRQHAAVHGEDAENVEEVKAGGKKGKAQYAGGLVLEPKKGLYTSIVLLLDFNSLYPSIIQEYNICFTTVQRPKDGSIPPLPEPAQDLAVLPKVIRSLVQRRREVKKLLGNERDPTRRQQLDIRQQALKLTANSMYGCLGFSASRFFARPLAELVTAQGRDILQSTVDLVHGTIGAEVIYGDTDSIMIRTDSTQEDEARALAQRVKKEVNQRYKLLEIEQDGMFKCMLLLKKKKYAAIKLERDAQGNSVEVKEAKGLDMVRRDWCGLAKDCGNFALDQILSGQPCEEVVDAIHAKLQEVRAKLAAGAMTLDKFVITKQLTKRPEDYPDAKNQPHVQVALRRRAANKRDGTMQGETVPYIICVELDDQGQQKESSGGLADRAYHRDELAANPNLRVDVEYYLANQVHPVVLRLCAPIEGTGAARLADCLGLDPAKYHAAAAAGASVREAQEDALLASASALDDDARYKDCQPLVLTHPDSKQAFSFVGAKEVVSGTVEAADAFSPLTSIGTGVGLTAAQLANQARLRCREAIVTFYDGALVSDDELHPLTTRNICLRTQGGADPGTLPPNLASSGHMAPAVSEAALYTQLTHHYRLLDPTLALSRCKDDAEKLEAQKRLAPIKAVLEAGSHAVEQLRKQSAYRYVNLRDICNVTVKSG